MVSCSSTIPADGVLAEISCRSRPVALVRVPKAEVMPSSAAFTHGSTRVSPSALVPPPSEAAPEEGAEGSELQAASGRSSAAARAARRVGRAREGRKERWDREC